MPRPYAWFLLTNTEFCYDSTVTLDVLLLKVVEKVTSSTYHLEESASGMVILLVVLQMFGKIGNSLCEDSYLYFGRTGVVFAETVSLDDSCLFFLEHHDLLHPFIILLSRIGTAEGRYFLHRSLHRRAVTCAFLPQRYDSAFIITQFRRFVNTFFAFFLIIDKNPIM